MKRDVAGAKPTVLLQWSARRMRPAVVAYVALVFGAFLAVAYFAVHSEDAVKALFFTAVATIVSLVAAVIGRIEYRMTDTGLQQRPVNTKKPRTFKDVFRWDQLGHIVPGKREFKFYKSLDEPNPFRRFWKKHLSDAFSGEVHVEAHDRKRVLKVVAERGVPMSKPRG